MWDFGKLATAMVLSGLAAHGGVQHRQGPLRVLRMGTKEIRLPFRTAPSGQGLGSIERAALGATRGGQIESIRPSVWIGKPVWMCTISRGKSVWHVMVSQSTLRPISKIVVMDR